MWDYVVTFVIGSIVGGAWIYYILVIADQPDYVVPTIPVFQQKEQVPPNTDEEYIHKQDISQFPPDWSGRAVINGLPEPWNPTKEISFARSTTIPTPPPRGRGPKARAKAAGYGNDNYVNTGIVLDHSNRLQ